MKPTPLIFNCDIIAIKKKLKTQNLSKIELDLLRHEGWSEHKVQSALKKVFDNLGQELEAQNIGQIFFYQIDNGGKLSDGGRIQKWQEGTQSGMTDCCVLAHSIKRYESKCWFIEVKKIGTESEIKGNPETKSGLKIYQHFQKQLRVQEKLRKMNFNVHLTNNTVYCEEVICKEIRDFINQ
jgi:hypothetical protein